ncbi:hypothetical protein GCM10010912_22510 [Paenibacillus albidus]|uniref:Stage III sporulation protein AF n=1 Tax=Paenibacillus albidus TaxID=2041023 RepID=A0A917C994_9BACL|nr:stage III sporulation protein AF [Paenibacillus albidus]GGF76925.1 hypothetical protein GCM10010912_22510 [Paenibacillus albidus]
MDWLGGWLREIILVVLLAAFVEMLLPSKSMERYARLVLSLLVLLTLLSPVVSLLKKDVAAELSLALGKQEQGGGLMPGQSGNSLQQILADGQKLAKGRQDQSLSLVAEEVAQQMQEQIVNETDERVKVTVKLGLAKAGAEGAVLNSSGEDVPVITAVQVVLQAADGAETIAPEETSGASGAALSQPLEIKPVEPVDIHIETVPETGQQVEDALPSESGKSESIIELLEQKWNLTPGSVQVMGNDDRAGKL